MTTPRNTDGLHAASQHKKTAAYTAAKSAIAALHKEQIPITFLAVARRAGVSTAYLYSQPELKASIQRLRTNQLATQPDPPDRNTDTGVTAVLRAKLKTEQATNQELRLRIRELETRVETLLGRILSQ